MNNNLKKAVHLGLATVPFAIAGCVSTEQKPNVILIVTDDVGYGDIEWLDTLETINTPNIKSIADESLKFSNAHCTSATSTPSRYGLLTGMYPWRKEGTGIANGDDALIIDTLRYTIADLFQDNGYATAAVGKWHLGLGSEKGKQNWNEVVKPNPSHIGFNYSYIMAATADRTPCVFIENGKVDNLDPNDLIQVDYNKNFEGEPSGEENPEMLRLHPSQGHNMAIVDSIPRIGFMKGGNSARWHDEDIADIITEKAVEFISNNKKKPFFLYFATNDIHVPRMPHNRFKGKSGMGYRGDAILSLDYSVGKIAETIKKLGLDENTIIIITSDNGPVVDDGYKDQSVKLLGNHKPSSQFRGGKYSAFEAGTRVPFMIRWKKGIQNNKVNDALFSQVDLFASLASVIGAKLPEKSAPDSKDFSKVLLGKEKKGREYIVTNNPAKTLSITTQDWKYIESSDGLFYNKYVDIELGNQKQEQLYNLENDKGEKNNLAKEKTGVLAKLKQLLKKERAKTKSIFNQ